VDKGKRSQHFLMRESNSRFSRAERDGQSKEAVAVEKVTEPYSKVAEVDEADVALARNDENGERTLYRTVTKLYRQRIRVLEQYRPSPLRFPPSTFFLAVESNFTCGACHERRPTCYE
jgi:hypothetical protein